MFETLGKYRERILLLIFLLVPFISSIISTFHIVDFVGLGNNRIMSIALAVTFELGALVSFVTIGKDVLKKLNKGMIMTVFVILFLLQSTGNIYASFDYIRHKLLIDPTWLSTFMEMTFNSLDMITAKFILSVTIGLPIPLISLILLKSSVDYMYSDEETSIDSGKPKVLYSESVINEPKPVQRIEPEPELSIKEKHPDSQNILTELQKVVDMPKVEDSETKTEEIQVDADTVIEVNKTKHGDRVDYEINTKSSKNKAKKLDGVPNEMQDEIDKYVAGAPKNAKSVDGNTK